MAIRKTSIVWTIALVAAALLWLIAPSFVKASPSEFAPTKETAAATTTLVYMSPGLATTTLSYDSLSGDSVKINTLNVAFQYTASNTAPTLNVRFEDSQNGVDWYPRSTIVGSATTSLMTAPYNNMSFVLSTTTDIGGSGTNGRIHESFTVNAPMRWVRAIFSVPQGTTNGGLWAQFIPTKETNNGGS